MSFGLMQVCGDHALSHRDPLELLEETHFEVCFQKPAKDKFSLSFSLPNPKNH